MGFGIPIACGMVLELVHGIVPFLPGDDTGIQQLGKVAGRICPLGCLFVHAGSSWKCNRE